MAKSSLTIIITIALSNLFFNSLGSDGRMVDDDRNDMILKTIHGDEYNCVDIYKQPAFEHPALKNHKIPTKFIDELEEAIAEKEEDENSMFHPKNIWLEGRGCPKGTVPIRRRGTAPPASAPPSTMEITREAGKKARIMCTEATANPESAPSHVDFAGIMANQRPGNNYYGGSAFINIYNPSLKGNDESSAAAITIEDPSANNIIQGGWMVNPSLNGDTKTRLFTGWSIKDGNSCYNDRCPGYVILNRNIPADHEFISISHVEKTQFDAFFAIYLDNSGNWRFFVGSEFNNMGYWPKELFGGALGSGGGWIYYGGVVTSSNNVSPQMGSGSFIDKEYNITCYMRQVKVVDQNFQTIDPDNSFITGLDSRCYYEKDHYLNSDSYWGYRFLFGGAGGKDCYDCLY